MPSRAATLRTVARSSPISSAASAISAVVTRGGRPRRLGPQATSTVARRTFSYTSLKMPSERGTAWRHCRAHGRRHRRGQRHRPGHRRAARRRGDARRPRRHRARRARRRRRRRSSTAAPTRSACPPTSPTLASVEALRDAATSAFGNVHLLCNNAGVGPPAEPQVWLNTPNDWRWTFGVNVFGVANGVHAFLPHMVEHGEDGHVVNTSSPDGGIVAMPNAGGVRVVEGGRRHPDRVPAPPAARPRLAHQRVGAAALGRAAAHRAVDRGPQPARRARPRAAPVAAGHDRGGLQGA